MTSKYGFESPEEKRKRQAREEAARQREAEARYNEAQARQREAEARRAPEREKTYAQASDVFYDFARTVRPNGDKLVSKLSELADNTAVLMTVTSDSVTLIRGRNSELDSSEVEQLAKVLREKTGKPVYVKDEPSSSGGETYPSGRGDWGATR